MIPRVPSRAACVLLGLLASGAASAQGAASSDRTLRELLDEVRLLRQVLQASSLVAIRAQILLAQRQDHHDRVAQVERQLNDTRDEARELQSQIDQYDEQIPRAEASAASESDAARRQEREMQVRQFALARDQIKRRLEALRQRELDLTATQSQEQAKLTEMQRGLDRIEKQLEDLQKSVSGAAADR